MQMRSPMHLLADTTSRESNSFMSPGHSLNQVFNRLAEENDNGGYQSNALISPRIAAPTSAADAVKASPRMDFLVQVAENSEKQKKKRQPPNPERKSNYRGVSWQKTSKAWVAQYKTAGKTTYLGLFQTEEEAARAYVDYLPWSSRELTKTYRQL